MTSSGHWIRRVRRPVFVWALIALATELAVEKGLGRGGLVALIPLLPALMFMRALVRLIQQMDELQRKICLDSVFIAFIATLTLAFVFGGLEQAGVFQPPWSELGTMMMALWACAYVYSAWKYR